MKPLLLIAALLAINGYAQTFPMLSTTTNRTVTGGVTNLALLNGTNTFSGPMRLTGVTASRVPVIDANGNLTNSTVTDTTLGYLDATSSVQTQLNNKPTVALTNLALLNGTNQFEAAKFFTVNKIGTRLLFATNVYIPTIAVVVGDKTNNGDYENVTKLFKVTMPPLLSTSSTVVYSVSSIRTNANSVGPQYVFYVGSNTNFLANGAAGSGGSGTSVGKIVTAPNTVLFQNWNSYTNQVQGGSAVLINNASSFVDTSSSWELFMGFYVFTTAYTNHNATYSFYEVLGQ